MRKIDKMAVLAVCLIALPAHAEMITIETFDDQGTLALPELPVYGEVNKQYPTTDAYDLYINPEILPHDTASGDNVMQIGVFDIDNRSYAEATVTVTGVDDYVLYCDGKKVEDGKLKLHPMTHRMVIKYKGAERPVSIAIDSPSEISRATDGKRMFVLEDVLCGKRIKGASVSADGGYVLVDYSDIKADESTRNYQRLFNNKGEGVAYLDNMGRWMPRSPEYMIEEKDYESGRALVVVNPATGARRIIARNIPDGHYTMSPTEDYLLYDLVKEGVKEDPEIYEIAHPEDRQSEWRDRHYPAIYRPDRGVLQPLTSGNADVRVLDISPDGNRLLLITQRQRLTQRPTILFSLSVLDLPTMQSDTIVVDDGFINDARFSPDGKSVAVLGSPEAFGRIGCVLPDDVTPSMYDIQMYLVDVDSKEVKPMTRNFDPSINNMHWNHNDGKIYVTVTERDKYLLYAIDPKTGNIARIATDENVVKGIDGADRTPLMAWWGQSDSNPDRVYLYNAKTGKSTLLDAPSDERFGNVRMHTYREWDFVNSRGDTIYGGYYLPDNFDPNKKYPLIVNYYGGCSPSTRTFESRYPFYAYAPLGYVVYVVNPSGAAGFGQEFSSRHVSTAGQGVAEDIIEGTKKFCAEHDFVDAEKIGCIGASYGGFMTQYLQTQTDIFSAAVSHAGISDHTSYWGEGLWGYTYSQTSMGADTPWSSRDLYVNQSPLYNADKVNTPILFLHGDADGNVPVGESIQMYTALKMLGKDTSLVLVKDQDHHILDYSKRRKWQDTIFAWFTKYLQDDPTWWEALYPDKGL